MKNKSYDDYAREELISRIKELEAEVEEIKSKRAYTYEDQLKLIILDNSPFSIWTSDRNCNITMWSGQCENMYGYKAEDIIGKNYLDAFVAEEERATAAKDHLSIIDDGKPFHNLAQDVHLDGSHPMILTNCFRIRDPKSGESWYAEMGLNVEFFDDELTKYYNMVKTSRQIKESRKQLETYADSFKELISNRINSLIGLMADGSTSARKLGQAKKYSASMNEYVKKLDTFIDEVDRKTLDYSTKIKSTDVLEKCEEYRKEYISECNKIDTRLVVLFVDIQAFLQNYDSDNAELAKKRDELIKLINEKEFKIKSGIMLELSKCEKVNELFNSCSDNKNESSTLKECEKKIEQYQDLIIQLDDLSNRWRNQVVKMSLGEDFENTKVEIVNDYKRIEAEI